MLYFNNDEERTARVERMFEELTRKPAPPKLDARVPVTTPSHGPTSSSKIAKDGSS
jgi:hypothetical protein